LFVSVVFVVVVALPKQQQDKRTNKQTIYLFIYVLLAQKKTIACMYQSTDKMKNVRSSRHGSCQRMPLVMMRMMPLVVVMMMMMIVLVWETTTCSAAAASSARSHRNAQQQQQQVDHSVLSLPLVPHHVQQQRRHRQRALLLLPEESDHTDTRLLEQQKESANFYRRHYPRRQTSSSSSQRQSQPHHHFLRWLTDTNATNSNNNNNSNNNDNLQVAALFQGFGTHYADLWCGTPPQRQTVIVDTGSGVTAFPCSGCPADACGVPKYHIDGLWMEQDSSTFHALTCNECLRGHCSSGSNAQCSIGMSYQEGSSWTAYEVQDDCYVGGLHDVALESSSSTGTTTTTTTNDMDPHHAIDFTFPLKFGCQTHLTGLFKTQLADGIMGMDSADASFWAQMAAAFRTSRHMQRQFALCFSRSPTAARTGTPAGAMTLGGMDARLHQTDMVFTTISAGRGFYNVKLRKVYLRDGATGGESAKSANPQAPLITLGIDINSLNRGSVIVDSGTTDTYFNRAMANPFAHAWQELMHTDYSHRPVTLTTEQLQALPTILFQIEGDVTMNQAVADLNGQGDPNNIVGLAGDLDPLNPYDVILAVPASHYYEYDEDSQDYTARFYTDEGGGSVLGANSIMGHDVFFDVDNNRIGWAESTCDYTTLVAPYLNGEEGGDTADSRQQNPTSNEDTTSGGGSSSSASEAPAIDTTTGGSGTGTDNEGPTGGETEDDGLPPPEEGTSGGTDDFQTTAGTDDIGGGGTVPSESSSSKTTVTTMPPADTSSSATSPTPPTDTSSPSSGSSSSSLSDMCDSGCKGGLVAGLAVAVVVGLTLVRRRRRRMTAAYEMAGSELELQTRGEAIDASEEEDGFSNIQYRDIVGGRGYSKAPDARGIMS